MPILFTPTCLFRGVYYQQKPHLKFMNLIILALEPPPQSYLPSAPAVKSDNSLQEPARKRTGYNLWLQQPQP